MVQIDEESVSRVTVCAVRCADKLNNEIKMNLATPWMIIPGPREPTVLYGMRYVNTSAKEISDVPE